MTNPTIDKLRALLDKYEIIDTSHLYHHEHDAEKLEADLIALLQQADRESRIDEIQKIVDWGKTIDDQWNNHFLERLKALKEEDL